MQICFSVFLFLYVYGSKILQKSFIKVGVTPKVFNRMWRMHEKSLSVHRDYGNIEWFIYKVVSEYAKSILACMENTHKEYKHIWRIRQEYFAVYKEYANRHKSEAILGEF